MKRCEQCNKIFDDSIVFCTNCGTKLVEVEEKNTTTKPQDESSVTMEFNPEINEVGENVVKEKIKKKVNRKVVVGIAGVLVLVLIFFAVNYLLGRSRQKERVVYYQDGNLVYAAIGEEPKVIVRNYAKELDEDVIRDGYSSYDRTIEESVVDNTVFVAGNMLFYLVNFDWGENSNTIQADLISCKLNSGSKKTNKVAHISFYSDAIFDSYSYYDESEMIDYSFVPYIVYPTEKGVKVFYSDEDSFYNSDLKKKNVLGDAVEELIYFKDSDTALGRGRNERVAIIDLKNESIQKELESDDLWVCSLDGTNLTVWYREADQVYYIVDGQEHKTDIDYDSIEEGRFYADGKCYYLVSTEKTIPMKDYLKDSMAEQDAAMTEPNEDDYYSVKLSDDYSYYQSYYVDLLKTLEASYQSWCDEYGYDYYEDYFEFLYYETGYYDEMGYLDDYVVYQMYSIDDLEGFWDYLEEQCTYSGYDWDAYDEAYNQYYQKENRDYIRELLDEGSYDNTIYEYSLYYFDGTKSELVQEDVQYILENDYITVTKNSGRTVASVWDMSGVNTLMNNAIDIKDMDSYELYDYQSQIMDAIKQKLVYITDGTVRDIPFEYSSDQDEVLVTKDCQMVILNDSSDYGKIQIYQATSGDTMQLDGMDFIYYDSSGLYWIENEDGEYDLYDGMKCIKKNQYNTQQVKRCSLSENQVVYLFNEDYETTKDAMIYDTKQDAILYEIEGVVNLQILENGKLYYTKRNGSSDSGRIDLYYYFDAENKGKIDVEVTEFVVDMKGN